MPHIDKRVFITDAKPIKVDGKTIMWELTSSGAFQKPFPIEAIKGEHDYKTCEECQDSRKMVLTKLTERFKGEKEKKAFPECCNEHANLLKHSMFKFEDFKHAPEITVDKIIFTNQYIINNHKKDDYYKRITDYFEYVVSSFGEFPSDYGPPLFLDEYFYQIHYLIQNNDEINKSKKNNLLLFLATFQTPIEDVKTTDFNVLLNTYNKWFKLFPFDLSFFNHLKKQFEHTYPLLSGKPEKNEFTGLSKVKIHTKDSLMDFLLKVTDDIISNINCLSLYEQGLLTKPQKTGIELAVSELKSKNKQGYLSNANNEEKRFRAILKDWFKDQKEFIDGIKDLINTESDEDFINGTHKLSLTRKRSDLVFEVTKGEDKRVFRIDEYYRLHRVNWETIIDKLHTKEEKLSAVNNAIFGLHKHKIDRTASGLLEVIDKNIVHFESIKEYIENSYSGSEKKRNESEFSIPEWASIFYYADEAKLTTEAKTSIERRNAFMEKHNINTTDTTFKQRYYDVKNKINKTNDYSVNKLEKIIPFLKEHYKETITKVENDIYLINEETEERYR